MYRKVSKGNNKYLFNMMILFFNNNNNCLQNFLNRNYYNINNQMFACVYYDLFHI